MAVTLAFVLRETKEGSALCVCNNARALVIRSIITRSCKVEASVITLLNGEEIPLRGMGRSYLAMSRVIKDTYDFETDKS